MALRWLAADLRTGLVLADLPSLVVDWPLQHVIGQYDTATAHLHLDGAPDNWTRATLPEASLLACYDPADGTRAIHWAGMVTKRVRQPTASTVDLSLATIEAYLDRRYVGDETYTAVEQNTIVTGLVTNYVADSIGTPGIPITVDAVAPPDDDNGATDRTVAYASTDNTSVYSALQALMGLDQGAEWTVDWDWTDDDKHLAATLHVGIRIGTAVTAGLGPATVWSMPGSLIDAPMTEDWSSGKGANSVLASSSGEGSSTPTSATEISDDFVGRPTFEYRFSPGSNIADTAVLDSHAAAALAVLEKGAVSVTLTAALSAAPRLRTEWNVGDDIGYALGGRVSQGVIVGGGNALGPGLRGADGGNATSQGPTGIGADATSRPASTVELVPAYPGGVSGVGRAIGYALTDTTIAPILAQPTVTA